MLQAEKILKKSQNKNFRTAAVLLRQSCSFVNKHKEIKIGQLLMTGSPEEKNQQIRCSEINHGHKNDQLHIPFDDNCHDMCPGDALPLFFST